MTINRARVALPGIKAIAVGLLIGFAPALHADDQRPRMACSVATINGSYGFYRSGQGSFGGPLAAIGLLTYDGAGHGRVIQNTSRDGDISLDETFSFTYTVSADCTGKGFNEDGSEFVRSVIVNDGQAFYFFSESEGATIYGVATRVHGPKDDGGQ